LLVRDLIRLAAAAGLVSAISLAACTGSESVDLRRDSGAVTSEGEAGNGGAAGAGGPSSGTGAGAGSSASGAAGASESGQAGTTGSTGTGAGTGSVGTAGTGSSGTAGAGGKVDAGAAGSTGSTDAGAVTVYTYTKGIGNLLVQNCGGCHYAAPGVTIQGGFSFSYANITGVTNGHPSCTLLDASKRRVVPGKPDNSLLWIKAFNDNPPASCGGHMPFQGSRLSDATLGYIKAWILAGAPE
jgi:hypothetical protein